MINYLTFWYQVIISSEELLRDAIFLLSDDGFEGNLKTFYKKHLEDEKDHAKWLKEDIGDNPITLDLYAAQLAGIQYYLIRHVHPVCLMGYMMVLEGGEITKEFIDKIEKELGSKASRTVKIHAEADPNHFEELKSFPIPEEFKNLVEISRLQTLNLLGAKYANIT
jgi:hypothetical protein